MLPIKREMKSPARQGAFSRALTRFKVHQQAKRPTRLGFIVDATGSREATWQRAQTVQAEMFRAAADIRALHLRLLHFGGGELSDHGWIARPQQVAAVMGRVRCHAGQTLILPALEAFLADDTEERASAVILIGDAFEEDEAEIEWIAAALRREGIRIFSFLEGGSRKAERVFRRLSAETGGAFAMFGAALPLGDLCTGVALLAAGGSAALKRLPHPGVRQLLLAAPAKSEGE